MQTLTSGYRGIALLLDLNWDLIFSLAVLTTALLAGAFLGSLFLTF